MRQGKENNIFGIFFARRGARAGIFCLALAAMCLAHTGARCENLFVVKRIKVGAIVSPTLSAPAIVRAGGDFIVTVSDEQHIKPAGFTITPAGGAASGTGLEFTEDAERGKGTAYRLSAPPGMESGLYDLSAVFPDGATDVQYHSVKIVSEYKSDFRFAVIADIHFGDTRGDYFAPGADFDILRRNILTAASKEAPEFILLVGDVTSMPNDFTRDYDKAWQYFRDYCAAPLFIVPGNHDGFSTKKKKNVFADGKLYWEFTFGPAYFYFDYGRMRFIGLDNFDWPANLRNASNIPIMNQVESINRGNMGPEQYEWLVRTLESAGDRTTVVFAHLPFDQMKGGKKSLDGSMTIPGVPAEDILDLFRKHGVEYLFIGHMHHNETRDLGGIKQVMTNTSGSVLYDPKQRWGFNIVHVRDWKIDTIEYREIGFK
jgi:UDP-2,3-diacylglucosamine pyrophosphatase LpxH